MNNAMRFLAVFVVAAVLGVGAFAQTQMPSESATRPAATNEGWTPLFDGTDLAGFHTFIKTVGLDNDPEGYFKVEQVDGSPAVHVMDLPVRAERRDFGYFITDKEYGNFQLRFEYKWGVKKHAPRTKSPRDAGCLYFVNGPDKVWPDSVECQVEEGDTGDLWIVGKNIEVGTTVKSARGNARGELTFDANGVQVKFRNGAPLTAQNSTANLSDAATGPTTTPAGPKVTNGRMIKDQTADGLSGWNTVEIFAKGNSSVHIVNGRVVNRFTDVKFIDSGEPLNKGRILFQAEGSEVWYRKMELRPLGADETVPATQAEYDARWQVNDRARPRPGRMEPESEADLAQSARPPVGAVILFDGKDLSAWMDPHWKVQDGFAEILPFPKGQKKAGGNLLTSELTPVQLAQNWQLVSKQAFGSCKVHVEFCCPNPPTGNDQARANSGVYLMGKYEMQVLDNTDNPTYADGLAGAVYGENPPLWDSCRASGQWNYYDIEFQRPVFGSDGKIISPAKVSAWLNGVKVQDGFELTGPTEHLQRLPYVAHPDKLPLVLQNHGQMVRFRNIWVAPQA